MPRKKKEDPIKKAVTEQERKAAFKAKRELDGEIQEEMKGGAHPNIEDYHNRLKIKTKEKVREN